MALSRRQALTTSLLVYWPAIFILCHIPIPKTVLKAHMSDKTLHFLAYLILVFLLWFAVSPDKKVSWRKAAVWWVFFVVTGYGVLDELLQGFVGRSCSLADFLANLVGTFTGLVLFSIFSFWPASLVVSAVSIFLLPYLAKVNLAHLLPATNAIIHLFAYGFFSLAWVRNMSRLLPQRTLDCKWLAVASSVPICSLVFIKVLSILTGRDFVLRDVIISAVGIIGVVVTIFLSAFFRRRFGRELSAGDSERLV